MTGRPEHQTFGDWLVVYRNTKETMILGKHISHGNTENNSRLAISSIESIFSSLQVVFRAFKRVCDRQS